MWHCLLTGQEPCEELEEKGDSEEGKEVATWHGAIRSLHEHDETECHIGMPNHPTWPNVTHVALRPDWTGALSGKKGDEDEDEDGGGSHAKGREGSSIAIAALPPRFCFHQGLENCFAMADLRRRNTGSKPAAAAVMATPDAAAAPPSSPPMSIKWTKLAILAGFGLTPYLLLLFVLPIQPRLLRSILINLAMSVAGFFVVLFLIPVASKYVLRRNMFGYDINKKGSPAGSVQV